VNLKKYLNKLFQLSSCPKLKWDVFRTSNSRDYLAKLHQHLFKPGGHFRRHRDYREAVLVNPVAVLEILGPNLLHWEVLVDILDYGNPTKCRVVLNSHQKQRALRCDDFLAISDVPFYRYTFVGPSI
jgi:hypothetical protein